MGVLKFLKYLCCASVGGCTVLFFMTGLSMSVRQPDILYTVILVFSVFVFLGLPAFVLARKKGLHISGLALWLYTTFVPIVSWIDIIAARPLRSINAVVPDDEKLETTSVIRSEHEKMWEKWELEHDKPAQRKRWERALKDCTLVKMLDTEQGVAIVKGNRGGEYVATLLSCSCSDFAKRMRPCKHMYLLAHNLGVFDPYSSL